jgi:LuxR family transcriptional regulator
LGGGIMNHAERCLSAELLETLVDITTSIFAATDRMGLFHALDDGTAAFGFDKFGLSCHKPAGPEFVIDATLSSANEHFIREYERNNWFDDDMNAARIMNKSAPLFFDTKQDIYTESRKKNYIDFLHSTQMCTGLLIPLASRTGTVSVMGMIAATNRRFGREMLYGGSIMANAAMAKAEMLGLCPDISADEAAAIRSLSRPQIEILKWITEGKSNLDIATIMVLNERTVRYHVTEILKKLGVVTRSQAARIFGASLGHG